MNFWKPFGICTIILFAAWLVMGKGADIAIGIPWALMLSFIFVGWAYAALLLIDDENQLYQIFAVIMTGLIGIIILLGIRWAYRKMGLHFLD